MQPSRKPSSPHLSVAELIRRDLISPKLTAELVLMAMSIPVVDPDLPLFVFEPRQQRRRVPNPYGPQFPDLYV